MGLSASQTRYLSLTARKSNVEYQGQQINQARTGLANQSAELYTELMNLKAPVAPSVYKYIISPAELPKIDWTADRPYPLLGDAANEFEVYYSANEPKLKNFNIPEYMEFTDEYGGKYYCLKNYDDNGRAVPGEKRYSEAEMQNMGTYFVSREGVNAAGETIKYTDVHVNANAKYTYNINTCKFVAKNEDIDPELPANLRAYNDAMSFFETYSVPTRTSVYNERPVDVTQAKPTAYKTNTTEKNVNEAQYAAAFRQYEQEKAQYEKRCEEINAKTEEIHEADKKLELQLKQLDTEQESIQTEYEAVKKVIDKNIENTYKTFG